MRKLIVAATTAACLAGAALAHAADEGVQVRNAWVRATAPGQKVAGAYMDITTTVNKRLVRVDTPWAATVEIHETTMENGVMKMRKIEGIDLPANKTVKLAPGGNHVMLIDIVKPLEEGDSVPLTIIVENADKSTEKWLVPAEVKAVKAPAKSAKPAKPAHQH